MFRWWPLTVCVCLAACSGGEPSVEDPPRSDSGVPPASQDGGRDAGSDSDPVDAGSDGGVSDGGTDGGASDAGPTDGGTDGGHDVGCVTCDTPPPPSCSDATMRLVYSSFGYCGPDGTCQYPTYPETCPYGCANGACKPCPRQCDGRECGDDGCGGTCGTCSGSQTCGGGGLPGSCGPEAGCGTWSAGSSLQVARAHPASVELPDGRLFVAGGLAVGGATRSAELYDPTTGTWTDQGAIPAGGSTPAGESNAFYSYPGAARLGTGRVLVTGYAGGVYALFNPNGATWTPGSGILTRLQPLVVPLANGQTLVSHGTPEGGGYIRQSYTYNDTTSAWDSSFVREGRYDRTAGVQLTDGRVLVASGIADSVYGQVARSAELYDPGTNTWSFTGAPRRPQAGAALARLKDGRVLLIGGTSVRGLFEGTAVRTSSVELYDPATGLWRDTGFLNIPRSGHTATVLSDGRVLVAGGVGMNGTPIPWVELYDVAKETWTLTAPLSTARTSHVTTQLADGRVLVAAGQSQSSTVLASTELVQPAGFCPTGGCVPESDDALCAKANAGCGTLNLKDACGRARQVTCGTCALPSTCGGAGIPSRCGMTSGGGWTVEVVDTVSGGGQGIVIEASGEPALAYVRYDPYGGELRYDLYLARRHSQGWSASPIQEGILHGDVTLVRTSTGLMRGAVRGRVHSDFSFIQAPILLSWDAGRWRDEVAMPSFSTANTLGVGMGLGPDDAPFVCILDVPGAFVDSKLRCFQRDGSGMWEGEQVDTPGDSGAPPSVAVGADGRPHLAYYDANAKRLVHAVKGASGWTRETVDASGDVGRDASLALDAQGRPHIAYRDETNQDLKYASWTGSAWSLRQVDSADDVGHAPALALDAQGHAHISYEDRTRGTLKYARWTGTAWEVSTVDASGASFIQSSLVLDASERAHIAYTSTKGLRYARSP